MTQRRYRDDRIADVQLFLPKQWPLSSHNVILTAGGPEAHRRDRGEQRGGDGGWLVGVLHVGGVGHPGGAGSEVRVEGVEGVEESGGSWRRNSVCWNGVLHSF